MIERPVGIVVSAGRTGTAFCGEHLGQVFPGAVSFHMPETLHQQSPLSAHIRVLRRFGLYQPYLGKLMGRTGLRNVSMRYLAGDLGPAEAGRELDRHRRRFYEGQSAELVIEANYNYFGLLPVLSHALERYRVAAVVRDPESWIASYLAKGGRYGKKDWLETLGLRENPARLGDEEAADRWPSMGPAERLAWSWNLVYSRICEAADADPHIAIFRFEDLFQAPDRRAHFQAMADFLGRFPDQTFQPHLPPDFLEQTRNAAPSGAATPPGDCSPAEAAARWCDPLRRRWGYPLRG